MASEGDRPHRTHYRAPGRARIHPDAAHLADEIGNLAQREGWQNHERTAEALRGLINAAQALADRCDAANVRRISPSGDVLPSWAMVVQLLTAWQRHDEPDARRRAAERATAEAYDACQVTVDGRLRREPWPIS